MTEKTTYNNQLRVDWIHALCSGDYIQGVGYLLDSEGRHSSFGVLCVLKGYESKHDDDYCCVFIIPEHDVKHWSAAVPNFILDEVGLSEHEATEIHLMEHNGYSFEDIAAVLRQWSPINA